MLTQDGRSVVAHPAVMFTAVSGMAVGSWLAGLIYDRMGYYTPAFGIGIPSTS